MYLPGSHWLLAEKETLRGKNRGRKTGGHQTNLDGSLKKEGEGYLEWRLEELSHSSKMSLREKEGSRMIPPYLETALSETRKAVEVGDKVRD